MCGGTASEQTKGIEAGEGQYIDDWDALEVEGVGESADDIKHEPEQELQGESARDSEANDEKSRGCDEPGCRSEIAGGKWAVALSGAAAIGFDIEEIVNEVRCRGAAAEGEKREECAGKDGERAIVGEQGRKKDEQVLRPLVGPEGIEKRANGMATFFENVRRGDARFADSAAQRGRGVGQHRFRGGGEQRHIRGFVANVRESAFAELVLETGELSVSGEIRVSVAAKNRTEDAEMMSDALAEAYVRSRCKTELATAGPLLLKKVEELAVVGQVGDVEFDVRGDECFESCFAAQQSAEQWKEEQGPGTSEDQERVNQGVGFDQGSIQIDAERLEAGCPGVWLG